MDEKFIQQCFAEMSQSTGEALAMLMVALTKQVDPHRLKQDLKATIDASGVIGRPTLAIQLATYALAAVDAEILLRQQEKGPKH